MKKLALFDFCETIADFQTLDPFLRYAVAREFPHRYKLVGRPVFAKACGVVTRILSKCGKTVYVYKKAMVRCLKGVPLSHMLEYGGSYYRERVRDHLIPVTIELIRKLEQQQCRIIILSGGSDLYIRHFAKEFGIGTVISAQIGFENGVCTGKLISECLLEEKVKLLRELLEKEGDLRPDLAVAVSDSRSDLPMLDLCKRKIVISHKTHQNWVRDDMEELIWE